MTLIVSPNLTVDRTLRLDRFVPGTVMRPSRATVTAGAKGVNVGRVLHALGDHAVLVGFVPTADEDLAELLFDPEPFELLGVPIAGHLRVATIYLEADGRTTVLNEPGPQADEPDLARLCETVANRLAVGDHRTMACSGSLPPGLPVDTYARLTGIAHAHDVEVVVDAAREVLAAALPAGPDLVTPNLAEAEAALGRDTGEAVDDIGPDVRDRALAAGQALVRAGARAAVVTAGAAGAALVEADTARWLPGVAVDVVNPIGAGDSLVGGYLHAHGQGAARIDAVIAGMATASASCEQDLAGGVDPARVSVLQAAMRAIAGTEVEP